VSNTQLPVVKTSSGLILAENFSAPTGWTNTGTFTVDSTRPVYVVFDRSPIVALTATPGGADAGGVREASLVIDNSGTMWLVSGAGDGTSGPGEPWRAQIQSSNDYGLTWTKYGSYVGLDQQNSSASTYPARDSLDLSYDGTTFYWQQMAAGNVTNPGGIPGSPYTSDLYTSTTPSGAWTWVRQSVTPSGSGDDANDDYASFPLLDNGTWYLFNSETTGLGVGARITYGTATVRTGPWTRSGNRLLPDGMISYPNGNSIENPKVFYSTVLRQYCCLVNTYQSSADLNSIYYASSITGFALNGVRRTDVQRVAPADTNASVIGLASPFVDAYGVHTDSDGRIGIVFDADPVPNTFPFHVGRSIHWAAFEPSVNALTYNNNAPVFTDNFYAPNAASLSSNWTQQYGTAFSISDDAAQLGTAVGDAVATVNGVSEADVTISFTLNAAPSCAVDAVFRYKDSNDFYFVDIPGEFNFAYFYKSVGGTYTNIDTWDLSQTTGNLTDTQCVVSMVGTTCTLWINGVSQGSFTDASITGAGGVGLHNGGSGTGNRFCKNFTVYAGAINNTAIHTYRKSATHSNVSIEWSQEFLNNYLPQTVNTIAGLDFRIQSSGDGYRLIQGATGQLQFQKVISGTPTNIGTQSGVLTMQAGFAHRLRVTAVGSVLKAYLDGELQASATDTTWSAGVTVGFVCAESNVVFRLFHMRSADNITVTGLQNGQTVVLRGPGKQPLATSVVSGGLASFTLNHHPASSIVNDNGTLYSGQIYGGDVYNVPIPSDPLLCTPYFYVADEVPNVNATIEIVALPTNLEGKWILNYTQTTFSDSNGKVTFAAVPQGCTVRVICAAIGYAENIVIPAQPSFDIVS
jgi:hypothetical protein